MAMVPLPFAGKSSFVYFFLTLESYFHIFLSKNYFEGKDV